MVIVQPAASRRTLVDRRTPSTVVVLVAELAAPDPEPLDDTETLDDEVRGDRELDALDAAETPWPSMVTVVSIMRPSAMWWMRRHRSGEAPAASDATMSIAFMGG